MYGLTGLRVAIFLFVMCILSAEQAYSVIGKQTVTHYRLITPVIFIWCDSGGNWKDGLQPGGKFYFLSSTYIDSDAFNIHIYRYDPLDKAAKFDFEDKTGTYTRSVTEYNRSEADYLRYYYRYNVKDLNASVIDYDSKSGKLDYIWTGSLNSIFGINYDVKKKIADGNLDEVNRLMGGYDQHVIRQMDSASGIFNQNVRGFLYFASIIISYDKEIYFGHVDGAVNHTDQWEQNRSAFNRNSKIQRDFQTFWSGERLLLEADVGGDIKKVICEIDGYPQYSTQMYEDKGRFYGELWSRSMVNKWGFGEKENLTMNFTAYYANGLSITDKIDITMDTDRGYRRLHRIF